MAIDLQIRIVKLNIGNDLDLVPVNRLFLLTCEVDSDYKCKVNWLKKEDLSIFTVG